MPGASMICTEMSLNGALIRVLNMVGIFVYVLVGVSGVLRNIAHQGSLIVLIESFRDMMIRVFGFLPSSIDVVVVIIVSVVQLQWHGA